MLILFAKVHFVEVPHASAKEVPRDRPNEEIYRNVSNVIDRSVRESGFSDQVLCGDYDEHQSAPLQDSYAQGEAVLPSGLRFLPTLPRCLTWWLQPRAVPSQQTHGDIVEQRWTNCNTNVEIGVSAC